MCGFAGFLDLNSQLGNPEAILKEMIQTLKHRGPNDQGIWFDKHIGIGLGHRRLAIIDVSPEGHQPMVSACGRYVIAYNGEIYNYLEIRKQLVETSDKQIAWRGHSDTEVALAAISEWGLEEALKRFNGMFAFALWDRNERILHIARDRLGEKPVYYCWTGKIFLFGSELKALKAHPSFNSEIDRNSLTLYFRYNVVPAPYSIYKEVYKLPAASFLSVPIRKNYDFSPIPGSKQLGEISPVAYWSAAQVAEKGVATRFKRSEDDIINELESLLTDAVRLRMEADVPLGAFLSGGIDSSIIVALMQAQSTQKIKTFSIGSHDNVYDEAVDAQAVAKYLCTDHTQLYVSPQEALKVIPRLPIIYDEPFADSSQIPTFLVSELARKQVTVSLSGDGGDELFGGYNRYFWGRSIWKAISNIPRPIRRSASWVITSISPERWDGVFNRIKLFLPDRFREELPGNKLHKLASVLASTTPDDMYLGLRSYWHKPGLLVKNGIEPKAELSNGHPFLQDFTERMMYLDLVGYLHDDILVKVDRASMGVSLEARVPFLDPRLVEFSWRLPLSMKIKDGKGKWILRKLLYKYVPQDIVDRPKWGFGLPIDEWLRGALRDWAESLLDESRLNQQGFLNPHLIRNEWREHIAGKRNSQLKLWGTLMFQAWLEMQ